jgi:hypothetical protein
VKHRFKDRALRQKKTDMKTKNIQKQHHIWLKVKKQARGSDRNYTVGRHTKMKTFTECFELNTQGRNSVTLEKYGVKAGQLIFHI